MTMIVLGLLVLLLMPASDRSLASQGHQGSNFGSLYEHPCSSRYFPGRLHTLATKLTGAGFGYDLGMVTVNFQLQTDSVFLGAVLRGILKAHGE